MADELLSWDRKCCNIFTAHKQIKSNRYDYRISYASECCSTIKIYCNGQMNYNFTCETIEECKDLAEADIHERLRFYNDIKQGKSAFKHCIIQGYKGLVWFPIESESHLYSINAFKTVNDKVYRFYITGNNIKTLIIYCNNEVISRSDYEDIDYAKDAASQYLKYLKE